MPAGQITAIVGATPAASRPCCVVSPGSYRPGRAAWCSTAPTSTAGRPATWRPASGSSPSSRSPPTASLSPSWSPGGRHPHQRWFRQWSSDDEAAVDGALAATGTADLASRSVDELSGGQRQRVWIALALAQGTPLLLLDEPTTFLDIAHQVDVLDLLAWLNAEEGRTIVLVIHDLNMACRYADRLVAMRAGGIVAQGSPAEVVTPRVVGRVFDLECQVLDDPITGTPLVLPIPARHRSGSNALLDDSERTLTR